MNYEGTTFLTAMTYVLMDNFSPCFFCYTYNKLAAEEWYDIVILRFFNNHDLRLWTTLVLVFFCATYNKLAEKEWYDIVILRFFKNHDLCSYGQP